MSSILVDTSLWIEHLRHGHKKLATHLVEGDVATHPFIIGELACGHIKNRSEILGFLNMLPMVTITDHDEIMQFIESRKLMGLGLGYIDMHLLASAALSNILLWTIDKSLRETAIKLNLAHE
jgi:predicted nucleic acid-binding protein